MDILESVIEQTSYETEYMLERGKPMPSKNHSKLEARFSRALLNKYFDVYDIDAELSLDLTTGKATPDVVVSKLTKDDWVNDEIKVKVAPIMVIEILSPTQGMVEITDKMSKIYFAAGVKSVWVVIPTVQTISVFSPNLKSQTFTDGIVKDDNTGIELDMTVIFPKKS